MSQEIRGPVRTFTAGAAIGIYRRVKLSAGKLALAAANEVELGTMLQASFADGEKVAILLRNAEGTCRMVAAAAITAGAAVNGAANGMIDDDAGAGSVKIGTALEAAGALNDVIEVLRYADTAAN